ncbi:hypothetical protein K502DRAFT_350991 [Neoconidiobolus thromboides FSU 785]|nr:hypothetical protein K502DRAFT_350991 [Neoconidiobolus thromboides FSU 785]
MKLQFVFISILFLCYNHVEGMEGFMLSSTVVYAQKLILFYKYSYNYGAKSTQDEMEFAYKKEYSYYKIIDLNTKITIDDLNTVNDIDVSFYDPYYRYYSQLFLLEYNNQSSLYTVFKSKYGFNGSYYLPTAIQSVDLNQRCFIRKNNFTITSFQDSIGATYLVTNNQLYLLGGIIKYDFYLDSIPTRQFFSFDLLKNDYTDLSSYTAKHSMPSIAFHTSTLIFNSQILFLGGIQYNSTNNNNTLSPNSLEFVYIYSILTQAFKIQQTQNYRFGLRLAHTTTYLEKLNCVLVYGGMDNNNYIDNNKEPKLYSDIQVLDLKEWKWKKYQLMDLTGSIFEIGRAWHSSQLINDKLMIFFGKMGVNDKNKEILIFDLTNFNPNDKGDLIPLTTTIEPTTATQHTDPIKFNNLYYNADIILVSLVYDNLYDLSLILFVSYLSLLTIAFLFLLNYLKHSYSIYELSKPINSELSLPNYLLVTTRYNEYSFDQMVYSNPEEIEGDEYGVWELNSHYED